MNTAYFAAASHIRMLLHRFNELRLDMGEDSPYINSGVMLMYLQTLRAEQDTQEVFNGELNVFYEEIVSQMKKSMPSLAERTSEL